MSTAGRPKVLVTATVLPPLLEQLRAECDVRLGSPAQVFNRESISRFSDIQGWLMRTRQPLDEELMKALPSLKVISRLGVGVENVDLETASRKGVHVCTTAGVLDAAVAELAIGMMITLGRQLLQGDRFVRSGQWMQASPPMSRDVSGKTIGIVGFGRIGSRVGKLANSLGMKVLYHDPHRHPAEEEQGLAEYAEWSSIFSESDFISLHLPLRKATRHLVGGPEFSRMKKTAYLVNCARGAVVDEQALVAALEANEIAGAGLDVMEAEPLDPNHPLCSLPNVLLLPHVGSRTVETRAAMVEMAVMNLLAGMRSEVPQTVANG